MSSHSGWAARLLVIFTIAGFAALRAPASLFAQSPTPTVPSDFTQRHKPPIVLAVDGFSPTTTLGGVERKTAYLGPALKSTNFQNMNAEIKTFGWSGDIARTAATVDDLKKAISEAVEVVRNDGRVLAIVARTHRTP